MRDTAVTVIWASPHFGHPIHKTLVIRASPVTLTQIATGMPIQLGFWEWGCPKRGDANITVTSPSQVKTVIIKHMHNKTQLQS